MVQSVWVPSGSPFAPLDFRLQKVPFENYQPNFRYGPPICETVVHYLNQLVRGILEFFVGTGVGVF